jgi:cell division protein FtsB
MVVKTRLRAFLIPLALYGVSGLVVAYFVHHAQSGSRGLETKRALKIEVAKLDDELKELKLERDDWEHRVAMFRSESVDRDLLDERARYVLNRLHRNDVVIMTGDAAQQR